ncbi:hypothetical protein HY624_02320 [Candidatus Uhrbacteria bacterium]|nr:hypothetical protein [Candidatus Uhrbacteria bacterium]
MTALEWIQSIEGVAPPRDVYCQTRDVAQARIEKLRSILEKNNWTENDAALYTATLAELAANCFDHNLGSWKDIPGCWLETTIEKNTLRAIVADRGQGILHSLKQVRPGLRNHEEALMLAFTEQLSGRAPENRGNGLKFVLRSLQILPSQSLLFVSGDAKLMLTLPFDNTNLQRYITTESDVINGTYAEIIINKI